MAKRKRSRSGWLPAAPDSRAASSVMPARRGSSTVPGGQVVVEEEYETAVRDLGDATVRLDELVQKARLLQVMKEIRGTPDAKLEGMIDDVDDEIEDRITRVITASPGKVVQVSDQFEEDTIAMVELHLGHAQAVRYRTVIREARLLARDDAPEREQLEIGSAAMAILTEAFKVSHRKRQERLGDPVERTQRLVEKYGLQAPFGFGVRSEYEALAALKGGTEDGA